MPYRAPAIAPAISASSKTTDGDFPPSSSVTRLSVCDAVAATQLAGLRRPGKGDLVDARMFDDPLPEVARRTGYDIEHAFRNAGFERDFPEFDRRQRRRRRRLQDDRAPGCKRGRDFPAREQERKVPGNDRADHADRLAHGIRQICRQRRRHGFAVVLRCGASVKFEAVDDRAELAFGGADGLPVVANFRLRQLFGALADKLRHLVNDLRATRRGHPRPLPGVEGFTRGRDRRIYVGAPRFGNVRERGAGRGIGVFVRRAGLGVAPRAADQQLGLRHSRCRHLIPYYTRSKMVAMPWPTPMHIVARP